MQQISDAVLDDVFLAVQQQDTRPAQVRDTLNVLIRKQLSIKDKLRKACEEGDTLANQARMQLVNNNIYDTTLPSQFSRLVSTIPFLFFNGINQDAEVYKVCCAEQLAEGQGRTRGGAAEEQVPVERAGERATEPFEGLANRG